MYRKTYEEGVEVPLIIKIDRVRICVESPTVFIFGVYHNRHGQQKIPSYSAKEKMRGQEGNDCRGYKSFSTCFSQ